uniref:Tyrosine-protein kinase n=1 Tax=Amphimedon queenslandica TaxID=400682 RepID=A0A1X7TJR5_AMPQE
MQILKLYRFPEAKWLEFGLNLGLPYPTLETIDANHRGNTSRCLMECLSKWLSKSLHPTWQTLANALKKLEAEGVAEKIEKTMVDPASQLLQHYSSRISGATLSEKSVHLLHTEGLISEETSREVKSCGYTLTDDAIREIYTAVAYDHNKLKSFASILRSTGTVSIANDLMKDCEDIFETENSTCDSCDAHNASSIITPASVEESSVRASKFEFQISEHYSFDEMRGKFGTFYFKVTQLVSHTIRVNQLEDFIEFLDDCYPEIGPNLTSAATVKDVMKIIKTKCNVINIAPVKEVVSFYSITEAKPLISDYSTTLDEFCHKLKLQFLLDKKLSISDFLICETIELVLDWDPAEHLLNDIRRLMEKTFQGLSRRIIVKSMHKGNSIIIICGAPSHLMNALQLRARANLTVLQEEFALMRLKIGHCTVYDRTIRSKELKIVAEETEICEGELVKLNPYHSDKESVLDNQALQILALKHKQELINSSMQASGLALITTKFHYIIELKGFKSKVKQIKKEEAASSKKRMLLRESEHLQSTLRIRISRKEVLQENENISVHLLEIQNSNSYKVKSTQTVLSSNGSICEAQDDYSDTNISFKKGELFKISTNGHEVQSLETGQKSAVPMKYIGYSRVELLYLFQFAITKEGLSLLPALLDDDKKAEYFVQKITDDPTLLQPLRELITKYKLFIASYNFETLYQYELTLKKGEVLEVVKYNENRQWWYMHSLHTDKEGYVPINYITPIEGEYSPMYNNNIYYHKVSHNEAKKRLSQGDTQAGTFLIRDSESNPGQYTLSLSIGFGNRHYRINITFNKYHIYPDVQFDSLNDLIHHYMMKADGLAYPLRVPLPKQAKRSIAFNKERGINKSSIKFLKCINAGQFGETWKGNWKGKGPVTIKTNIATDITQEKFLEEANILGEFYHKNIISLYGVCIESYPFYIVTQPMNGNLKYYLTTNNLTPAELVDIAIQVTEGMMYLGEQDYIHCDLRAENILLGDHNTVKIANFRLAQHLNGKKYWTVERGTHLAIRWTAPEGHTLNQLSIKSDVWSFGILLWELVTKGYLPYPSMTDKEVCELVSKGNCTYIPRGCPKPFDQLMINCWKHKDYERPSFKDFFDVLVKYDTHDS